MLLLVRFSRSHNKLLTTRGPAQLGQILCWHLTLLLLLFQRIHSVIKHFGQRIRARSLQKSELVAFLHRWHWAEAALPRLALQLDPHGLCANIRVFPLPLWLFLCLLFHLRCRRCRLFLLFRFQRRLLTFCFYHQRHFGLEKGFNREAAKHAGQQGNAAECGEGLSKAQIFTHRIGQRRDDWQIEQQIAEGRICIALGATLLYDLVESCVNSVAQLEDFASRILRQVFGHWIQHNDGGEADNFLVGEPKSAEGRHQLVQKSLHESIVQMVGIAVRLADLPGHVAEKCPG